MQIFCHRMLFPRKRYRFLAIWQVFWLAPSAPSSHAAMASHSDVSYWASIFELTAAGLRRTFTGFPLGTLFGRPNRLQKYKKNFIPKTKFQAPENQCFAFSVGLDSNCLIINTMSISSPTQLRINSDPSPTMVGDGSELIRFSYVGETSWGPTQY